MAKGKKTGGKNWEKGKSGNPKGGTPVMLSDIVERKTLDSKLFATMVTRLLYTPVERLEEIADNKQTLGLEALVAGIISKAVKDRDIYRANFLLDRLLGRVAGPGDINLNVTNNTPPTVILSLDDTPETIDVEPVGE